MAPTESFHTIDGCKIRMMRAGTGTPLLFLHGMRGASAWRPFMQKLAARFDVIVPEHPGFGGSDTPDWLDTVGDVAYFYLDLIKALQLPKLHLVGASLGGWIAAEMAVRSCHDLKSLVLTAPAGIHVKGVSKGDIFMWSPEESIRKLFVDQTFAEPLLQERQAEDAQVGEMKNRLTLAKLAWQPRLYAPHLAKWLHRISVPTLILWGSEDKVIPAPYGKAYAALIPGARLEIIGNAGHVPQIERADEWLAKVTAFVEKVP